MPDHEQLPVRAARSGDSAAWNTLFQRFQLPLYSFVVELVRHEQAALDIVQESFTSAIRHIDSLRDDRRFGSWLFAIAHQRVVQHWRRESRTAHVFQETDAALESVADDAENPRDGLVRKEREAEFFALLERLPEPQRAVLLLHFVEDFSLDEIATVTDASLGTVKSRLHYAKKALRQLWKNRP